MPKTNKQSQPKAELPLTPREIEIRVIFLRIGDIDTLNEKFFAEILIESKWEEPRLASEFANSSVAPLPGITRPQSEERELTTNANRYWNPQIYIENALNDPQQTMFYKIKKEVAGHHTNNTTHLSPSSLHTIKEVKSDNNVQEMENRKASVSESGIHDHSHVNSDVNSIGSVDGTTYWMFEYRKVKGYFFEKLELNYFPVDTQDLSIIITTFKSNREVMLIQNRVKSSVVNSKITLDKHIW
jgi:hypothetical protein